MPQAAALLHGLGIVHTNEVPGRELCRHLFFTRKMESVFEEKLEKRYSFVVHRSFPVTVLRMMTCFTEDRLPLELELRGSNYSFWKATEVLGKDEPLILDVRAQRVGAGAVKASGLEALSPPQVRGKPLPRPLGQEGTERQEAFGCC